MTCDLRLCPGLRMAALTFALVLAGLPTRPLQTAEPAESNAAVEQRLYEAVKFLASDELEGRGVGTKGIDQAADYIAEQFTAIGLKTDLFDGGPFQSFPMVVETVQGEPNRGGVVGAPSPAAARRPKCRLACQGAR
jgi:hypothetical protein